jgi:hypothetical protein
MPRSCSFTATSGCPVGCYSYLFERCPMGRLIVPEAGG